MSGVQEEAAKFRRDDAFTGLERFRRLSGFGPVYEVLSVEGDRASVRVIEIGERANLLLADVLADPIAP